METLYLCRFCGKQCKNANSLRNHERLCHNNPNKQISYLERYNLQPHDVWNKGLTKETDIRVKQSAQTLSKTLKVERYDEDINDDGKLYYKYLNKCNNAKSENLECLLTYSEYCDIVREANLKSSDLGFSGKGYVLARYNDSGNYIKGNCRFITQKENSEEKLNRIFPNRINKR